MKFGADYTMLRLDRRTVKFVKGAFDFSGIHAGTAPGVSGHRARPAGVGRFPAG